MKRLLFDIETDGLLAEVTKVHCIVTLDLDTSEVSVYDGDQIEAGVHEIEAASELWGHNILGFDLPVLKKLYGVWCNLDPMKASWKIRDTLICSQHMWLELKVKDFAFRKLTPDFPGNLIGSHSLKAWGWRLGEKKDTFGETADWKVYTPEMRKYCIQDVHTNKKLVDLIVSKKYSEAALDNEHRFAYVIWLQEQHGFRFDRKAAVSLYATLCQRRNTLEKELRDGFSGWSEDMKVPAFYKLTLLSQFAGAPAGTGLSTQHATKTAAEDHRRTLGLKPRNCSIEAGPLKQRHTAFNPGSHDHIAKFLIQRYGWKPSQYGDDGKPSTTEEILVCLPYPEITPICEYLLIEKRIGQLAEGDKAWLKLEKNGRVHGRVSTNGAVSTRVTHSNPNMSQVPAVDKPYGKECRALFVADEGHVLVGADASGIQLRSLAHYLYPWDGGAYGKIILEGDIHKANQEAAGFATRDMAKTFIYAFLLGAQAGKVGSIAGVSRAEGQKLIDSFLKKFPALASLKAAVSAKVKERGYLVGLDGCILPTRSEHAALSSLLQGFEARVMKRATWITHSALTKSGLVHGKDFAQVGFFHDELQLSCRPDLGEIAGQTVVSAIEQAGKEFDSKCPLTGAYRVGKNWCETH